MLLIRQVVLEHLGEAPYYISLNNVYCIYKYVIRLVIASEIG